MNETRVRFVDDEHTTTLLVESSRSGGMIAPLVDELARLGLTVRRIESRNTDDGARIESLVVAEPYDAPLRASRVAALKAAVFGAVERVRLESAVA